MIPGDIGFKRIEERRALELHRHGARAYQASIAAEGGRREFSAGQLLDRTKVSFGWFSLLKIHQLIDNERRLLRNIA